MIERRRLTPHTVQGSFKILFISLAVISSIATAEAAPAQNKKVYFLRQNTVWAANHRLTITPVVAQIDADHVGFKFQYSIPDQMIYAWKPDRKEYIKQPVD